MLTSLDFYKKYGHPNSDAFKKNLVMWDVPANLEVGVVPKKIYCLKDFVEPFSKGVQNVIDRGFIHMWHTWDGCYNVRPIRGYEGKYGALMKAGEIEEAIKYLSIHSFGGAFDMNAFENGLGKTPNLPMSFVVCFTDAGFDWGGNFKRKDGMHFQLSKLPT